MALASTRQSHCEVRGNADADGSPSHDQQASRRSIEANRNEDKRNGCRQRRDECHTGRIDWQPVSAMRVAGTLFHELNRARTASSTGCSSDNTSHHELSTARMMTHGSPSLVIPSNCPSITWDKRTAARRSSSPRTSSHCADARSRTSMSCSSVETYQRLLQRQGELTTLALRARSTSPRSNVSTPRLPGSVPSRTIRVRIPITRDDGRL
jgi:hypothetical protein